MKSSSICPEFRRRRCNYDIAVHRLAKAKNFSGIEEIIEHQKQYPDIRDESFVGGFILLFGNAKMYDHARKLFDEMPQLDCQRTVYSFNVLLNRASDQRYMMKLACCFVNYPINCVPNLISYNLAMKALCKAASVYSGVLLMDEIEKHGIKPDIVTCNTLLKALCDSKRFSEAENLWVMMEKRNILPDICSYDIRLRGLLKVAEVSEAIQLFEEIVKKGFKPDKFSYNNMIKVYVDEGNLEQANMWYQKMVQNDCLPDSATFHMLIPLSCDMKKLDFPLHLCTKAIDSQVLVYRHIMRELLMA